MQKDIDQLKLKLNKQNQVIISLENELAQLRSNVHSINRDLEPLKNDRKRILKIIRPLLPLARSVRKTIYHILPFLRPANHLTFAQQKYIFPSNLAKITTDKMEVTTSSKGKFEIMSSTIQGWAIKDISADTIINAQGCQSNTVKAFVKNFLSSTFHISKKDSVTSEDDLKTVKQDNILQNSKIDRSHIRRMLNSGYIHSLKFNIKRGKCEIFFPAINMGKFPSIDVIIPVHNDCKRLEYSIKSVLNQRYNGNINVIVVDDASTDNPENVATKFDSVRYLRMERNLGTYSARNAGLEVAKNELVTFQDSDDISLPYRLARAAYFLTTSNADLYIGTYLRYDPNGRIIATNGRTRRRGLILLTGQRELIWDKMGGFDRIKGGADSEFIERAESLNLKIFQDDIITYLADQSLTGLTTSGPLKIWNSKGKFKQNKIRDSYIEAYREWHQTGSFLSHSKPHESNLRQFQAPINILDGSWSNLMPFSGDKIIDMAAQRYFLIASPFNRQQSWYGRIKQARLSRKKVTVAVVSNRGGELVRNAFRQIRAFHYPDIQIIYVANSPHALMPHDVLGEDVMQIETDPSKNLGHCLNIAAKIAEGEYFLKIDDDDYYGPDYAAEAVAALESGYDFVGKWSIFYLFETDQEVILRPPNRDMQQARHLSGATFAIKSKLVREICFSETLHRGSDADFVERAKKRGITLFSTSAFNFAVGRNSNSSHTWQDNKNDLLKDGYYTDLNSVTSIIEPNL